MSQDSTSELLTVDQYAQRLQISRATVFNWIHSNILTPGVHYLKIGRVLRFIWSTEALKAICQTEPTVALPSPLKPGKRSPLNWDY